MKKMYIKPSLKVVDLRPEEQIGACPFTWEGNKANTTNNKNCYKLYTLNRS